MGLIVPEDKGDLLFSSEIASNVPNPVAIVPEDQGHQLDSFIVTPSTPGTSVPVLEDQESLYSNPIIASSSSETEATIPEGDIASTIPGVQNNQASSGSVHCDSRQTREKEDICLPINDQVEGKPTRKQPDQDRPNELVEPEQDGSQDAQYNGPRNPPLTNADNDIKRCSNAKRTLCCDGPARLTQWVSNCFICVFLFLLYYPCMPPTPPKNRRES